MRIQNVHVVLLVLVAAMLVGTCLLTSSGHGEMEGARPWSAHSALRAIVELLNLHYAAPTPLGVEIKSLVFGLCTGAAMLVALVGWNAACTARGPQAPPTATSPTAGTPPPTGPAQMSALSGAQLLLLILVAFSFFSANWSFAPTFSLGGSVILAAHISWAVALGRGLNPRAARIAAWMLLVVLALTAALAVWYFYERNPAFRAKYPVGNPLFLAAVLLPGLVLALTLFGAQLIRLPARISARAITVIVVAGLCAVVIWWGIMLTGTPPAAPQGPLAWLRGILNVGPRATLLGLASAAFALPFFLLRRRGKIILACVGAGALLILALALIPRWESMQEFGRGATVRLRLYAWSYALDMIGQRKLTGVGQGGYALLANNADLAGRDAMIDPIAMRGRLAHAHNEWIETWADLGTIGLAVLVGGLLLTFIAGAGAVHRQPDTLSRAILAALLAALVGLIVEESANVGLRIPGLPGIFFTLLGLIWALSANNELGEEAHVWCPSPGLRRLVTVVVAVFAVALVGLFARDWQGARAEVQAADQLRAADHDRAILGAEFAARARLDPLRRLDAHGLLLDVYTATAARHVARAQQRAQRVAAGQTAEDIARPLIVEDFARAEPSIQRGLDLAERLRRICPGLYGAGLAEANLCALLLELDRHEGGDVAETAGPLRARAVDALKTELVRQRDNLALALRYVASAADIPAHEQIEALCGPLRAESGIPDMFAAVQQLSQRPEFLNALRELVTAAHHDPHPDDPAAWRVFFAPEAFRLAAAIEGMHGRYAVAAQFAARAVTLYNAGRNVHFLPIPRALTLLEQARYTWLMSVREPDAARRLAEEALETMPPIGRRDELSRPIYGQLLTLALAAGNEDEARNWGRLVAPGITDDELPLLLADSYAALAEVLLGLARNTPPPDSAPAATQPESPESAPAETKPAPDEPLVASAAEPPSEAPDLRRDELFDDARRAIDRAHQLAPGSPRAHWAAAELNLQRGDDEALVAVLHTLLRLDEPHDPADFLHYLDAALRRRPDSAALRRLREDIVRMSAMPPGEPSDPAPRRDR